jgi:hypothetical protein
MLMIWKPTCPRFFTTAIWTTMGSLYEPSIRSSTYELPSRGFSKRFTTLEGWREIGAGVYAMGNSNIRMFSMRNQFDPEHINVDQKHDFAFTPAEQLSSVKSVTAVVEYRRSLEGTSGKAIGSLRDTKGGVVVTSTNVQHLPPSADEDLPGML